MTAETTHHINDVLNELAAAPPEGFWFDATPEPPTELHDDTCRCSWCCPCDCGTCEECVGMSYDEQVNVAWQDHHSDQYNTPTADVIDAWMERRGWFKAIYHQEVIDKTTNELWEEWERLHRNLRFHMEVKLAQRQLREARLAHEIALFEGSQEAA